MALSKAAAKKDSRACVLAFVGNYDYLGENKIKDDVVKNDYELIKKAVRSKFGDQNVKIVPPIYNLTVKDMSTFVSDWKKHLQNYIKNGDMVLVWVEGHGFTAGGASLLVPVDVDLEEHFGEWEQSSRLKHLINELQILNKEGVNHVVWNLCRESKIDDVPLMDNMAIKGSNFVILFGCQDNTLNSIGNNSVMKDGAAIRVSNVAYAYAQALKEELTLLETCRRTRNLVMKLTSNHQIPQTLETLTEPPKSFGFLGLLGQFMWNVVLKPAVKVVAHAGLDMVNWGAQQLVRAGHEAVDNFSFFAGGDSVGPFLLQQLFDMQRKTGLTCLEFVLPDINHVVDFKAPGDTHMPKGAAAWNIIHASTPAVLQIVDTFFSGPVSESDQSPNLKGMDLTFASGEKIHVGSHGPNPGGTWNVPSTLPGNFSTFLEGTKGFQVWDQGQQQVLFQAGGDQCSNTRTYNLTGRSLMGFVVLWGADIDFLAPIVLKPGLPPELLRLVLGQGPASS